VGRGCCTRASPHTQHRRYDHLHQGLSSQVGTPLRPWSVSCFVHDVADATLAEEEGGLPVGSCMSVSLEIAHGGYKVLTCSLEVQISACQSTGLCLAAGSVSFPCSHSACWSFFFSYRQMYFGT
jgi:hypothetical protein